MLAGRGKLAAMKAAMGYDKHDYAGKGKKGKKPMKMKKEREDMGALSAFAGKKRGRPGY